ncbi:hypothetical protein Tco_1186963, partial [Tanacetum coccineum]
TVMLDFEDSTITYTAVSSPFRGLSDIGSLRVDRPPVMPDDPYVYVVAAFQAPPSPDYVSGPEYPPLLECVPEPPLPTAALPTADSPGYVPESDPKEDPEEDDDEDPEEDPTDYPADGGDDGNDEDESSDDDVDIEGDEEEEEHPAPANSTVVALLAVDHAPSAKETELFETDESAATPPPHPVARLLAIPTPPPSPLSPWSSPLPQIPSPPLLPIPLPTSSPSLHLLSTDRRADKPEVTLLPRKRLGIALGLRYEVGESSSAPTARPPGGNESDSEDVDEELVVEDDRRNMVIDNTTKGASTPITEGIHD